MTTTDFLCLTPFLILAGAPLIMMLTIAISRHYGVICGFSVVAFLAALFSVFFMKPAVPHSISPLFLFDPFSLFFLGMIIVAGLLIAILSYGYLKQQLGQKEEYFIILFVATFGAALLAVANHFVSFFLGIETLSVSLYVLIAYKRQSDYSIEAGVKYLILASVSSAFLLFGMALIYASTGTMDFNSIAIIINTLHQFTPIMIAGFAMILVGIGFKLALFPFHMWTPDVYQGAPAPISGFIATASKGAVMALLLRIFYSFNAFQYPAFVVIISIIAVFSMFVGNLLALKQQNVKRILGYSSIANLGYLLVTVLTGGNNGIQAAIFYLIAYFITTIGAFGVVSILSVCGDDADKIENYKGLFWKRPWIAIVFTMVMLSLAGIPLTAGFMAKFYIVFAGMKSGLWLLVISLVINSVISLYYYLRVVTTMFSPANREVIPAIEFGGNFVLAVIAFGIIWLGTVPGWLLNIISQFSGFR
jgi:NADH-quinone oxidoreductase subunit N